MFSKGGDSTCKGLVAGEKVLRVGTVSCAGCYSRAGRGRGRGQSGLGARLGLSRAWEAIVRSLGYVLRTLGVLIFKNIFRHTHGMIRTLFFFGRVMQDISSPTRDRIHAPCFGSMES